MERQHPADRPRHGASAARIPEAGYDLLERGNAVPAIWGSVLLHVALTLLYFRPETVLRPDFLFFFLTDTVSWVLVLIPATAVIRRKLAWYEPLSLLTLVHLTGMFSIFAAYLYDPAALLERASFLRFRTLQEGLDLVLPAMVKAELVRILYFGILLLILRRVPGDVRFDKPLPMHKLRAGQLFTVLLVVIGAFSFMRFWSSGDLIYSLFFQAKAEFEVAEGAGRYGMLLELVSFSLPLGTVLTILAMRRGRTGVLTGAQTIVFFALVAFALPQILARGGRLDLAFTGLAYLALLYAFRLRLPRAAIRWMVAGGLFFLLALTLLRNLPFRSGSPAQIASSLVSGDAFSSFTRSTGKGVPWYFHSDRVLVVAMILEFLEHGRSMMMGSSYLGSLLRPLNAVLPGNYVPAWAMSPGDLIKIWRFGSVDVAWQAPPSYSGEFLMNFGIVGVAGLSALFGFALRWLRGQLLHRRALIAYYAAWMVMLTLVQFSEAQSYQILKSLLIYFTPGLLLYTMIVWMLAPARTTLQPGGPQRLAGSGGAERR